MSMDDFVQTLSEEQKAALLKALSGGDFEPEVESRWQHEEPISEAVDSVEPAKPKPSPARQRDTEDFTMRKSNDSSLPSNTKRQKVQAGKNTWVDTGSEAKDVKTPNIKPTVRNRKPPAKKQVICHICGKKTKVNANLVYGEYYRCDRCTGR